MYEILQRFFLTSFFSVLAYLDIADCCGTTRQGLPLRPLPPILTFNLTEIWKIYINKMEKVWGFEKYFSITRIIYWNCNRSDQFLKQNTFSSCYWRFLEFKYIGTIKVPNGNQISFKNPQEKVSNIWKEKKMIGNFFFLTFPANF